MYNRVHELVLSVAIRLALGGHQQRAGRPRREGQRSNPLGWTETPHEFCALTGFLGMPISGHWSTIGSMIVVGMQFFRR